jgi:hypothetical protein
MMGGIPRSEIDDEDAGGENSSGVGLNTTLPPDPEKASDAFAGGPELGDSNASGEQLNAEIDDAVDEVDAQTDVNVDPHWRKPILPKSDKAQP